MANCTFTNRSPSVDIAKESLRDLLVIQANQITTENIQKTVAEYIETAPKKEDGFYEDDHWMANYPFDVKYFQEFITFVERSGGFTIS